MNQGSTSTLAASAKYDDQGFFFSLLLGLGLTLVFGPFVLYLSSTNTLWLKRLYRPNHTIEPPPAPSQPSATAPTSPQGMSGSGGYSSASGPPSPRSPRSPRGRFDDWSGAGTPSGAAPVVRSSHGRRKRLGISLPYTSSFYQFPSWRDWCSVEESVPHLESALSELSVVSGGGAPPAPSPSASASAPSAGVSNAHAQQDVAPIPLDSGSFLSPGSIDFRQVAGSQVFARLIQTSSSAVIPEGETSGVQPHTQPHSQPPVPTPPQDERTPLSDRGQAKSAFAASGTAASTTVVNAVDGRTSPNRVSYGTVPPGSPAAPDQASACLPRTPLDPQVALYIFTLKYFVSFLVVGCCFVSWICWIASSDDAVEWMLLRNDPYRCGKQGTNETGCLLLQPYCSFLGSDIGCTAVPLPGIYDLTVKNIRPRSNLWWWVGLLNIGFVASFIVITLYFMQSADVYITKVMKMQMQRALGYRVACVCGLGEQKKRNRRKFEKLYLSADAYFPSPSSTTAAAEGGANVTMHTTPLATTTVAKTATTSASRRKSVAESIQENVYRRLYCPSMSCLFSIARVHVYETTIEQLVFAKPGRVKAILFTRKAPENMYPAIGAAEEAISNLQEAIAQQNALTRQKRYHQRTRSQGAGSESNNNNSNGGGAVVVVNVSGSHGDNGVPASGPVLYQYIGCCSKVSAVPYREAEFREWGTHLDALLEQVPKQPATGAVFIEFRTSRSAFEFVNMFETRYGGVSSRANALIAGPPGHIIESNLNVDKFILALRFVLLLALYVALLLTWSIPVGFLGSLDNIALVLGPAFRDWLYDDVPVKLRSLAVAYLPVIVLALFNLLLPFLIRFIVIAMGAVNKSECDGGHLYLQYVFMVLTAVVFQAALQGSLAEIPNLVDNMGTEQIVNLLVSCVTPQSGYWYAKVIMSTALSTWMNLIDPIAIINAILFRNRARVQRRYDAIFRPTEFQYPQLYSFDIMVLSIGVLFHMTAPLLVPFVALYFIVRYVTQRAKLYDRYRPSFAAPQDCTDFGVSAQVMRAVITLLCFAEMCGLFVMSLKKHTGGMILCSMTLGASLVLAVYVYVQTRTWITTLGNARRFFPDDVYRPPVAAGEEGADQRETHLMGRPIASPSQEREPSDNNNNNNLNSSGDAEMVSEEDARCETDSNGSSLRTFSDVSPGPESPRTRNPSPDMDGDWPRSVRSAIGTAGAGGAAGGSTPGGAAATAAAGGSGSGGGSGADERAAVARSRRLQLHRQQQEQQLLREEDVMDEYENLRVLPSISGRSTNPYMGHLLPRKAGLRHLYQPKHQRLAIIDVEKEISAMMETEFVVERYWDRGMTWFEADAAVQRAAAAGSPVTMAGTPHTTTRATNITTTIVPITASRSRARCVGPRLDGDSSASAGSSRSATPVSSAPSVSVTRAMRAQEGRRASPESADAELPTPEDSNPKEKKDDASHDEL